MKDERTAVIYWNVSILFLLFRWTMTQFLPPNLLALFAPRDPIPFLPQLGKLPHEKHHNQPYSGIAPFIKQFEVRFELRNAHQDRNDYGFEFSFQVKGLVTSPIFLVFACIANWNVKYETSEIWMLSNTSSYADLRTCDGHVTWWATWICFNESGSLISKSCPPRKFQTRGLEWWRFCDSATLFYFLIHRKGKRGYIPYRHVKLINPRFLLPLPYYHLVRFKYLS